VRQEGIAQTGTSRGTTGQTGNVVDCEVGRDPRLGLVLLAQPVEASIGNDDARLLGVNGGIGEVLAWGISDGGSLAVSRAGTYGRVAQVALGDGLEERGLANVG